jgi:hypothetical protein
MGKLDGIVVGNADLVAIDCFGVGKVRAGIFECVLQQTVGFHFNAGLRQDRIRFVGNGITKGIADFEGIGRGKIRYLWSVN